MQVEVSDRDGVLIVVVVVGLYISWVTGASAGRSSDGLVGFSEIVELLQAEVSGRDGAPGTFAVGHEITWFAPIRLLQYSGRIGAAVLNGKRGTDY